MYRAVNEETLRALLKEQCSPIGKCRCTGTPAGYVVGPVEGREVAHLATCRNIYEAQTLAAKWNAQ